MKINTNEMTLFEDIKNVQSSDLEFIELSNEATSYLLSHKWCKNIEKQWLAANWENLLVIFFFKIIPNSNTADDYVWIVVGDLPPAYIDIESAKNVKEVVHTYIEIMNDWVQCVFKGGKIEDFYPINVPPTREFAEMLNP